MAEWHDTTEEYLEAILEIEEEGIVPIRARLVERLGLSAPAVSETVNRLVDHGYAELLDDRTLRLTAKGREVAVSIVRRHRLAERLLVDVIGLEWEQVHAEACRWEHVMSEAVERRVLELLRHPTESPYGNPIPGLAELGEKSEVDPFLDAGMVSLMDLDAGADGKTAVVRRIGEPIQADAQLMYTLRRAGVQPGAVVSVTESPAGVLVGSSGEAAELGSEIAAHVFVAKR